MKRKLLAPSLESHLDVQGEQFDKNRSDILEQLKELEELLDEAEAGGGPETTQRHRSKGKMPIRERIANVLDPDSPFLEISPLAAANSDYTVGGGFVVGISCCQWTYFKKRTVRVQDVSNTFSYWHFPF